MSCPSHLLSLPTELRLQIYNWLFDWCLLSRIRSPYSSQYCSYIRCPNFRNDLTLFLHENVLTHSDSTNHGAFKSSTAILRACRVLYSEAIDILYDRTTFKLHVMQPFSTSFPPSPLDQHKGFLARLRHVSIVHSQAKSIVASSSRTPSTNLRSPLLFCTLGPKDL